MGHKSRAQAAPSRSQRRKKTTGLGNFFTPGRVIGGSAVILTLGFLIFLFANGARQQEPNVNLAVPDESVAFEIQGRDHIDVGALHPAYNSNPPTSGWHYADPLPLRIFDQPQADEALVHNLEHGQIWLSYHDADDQEAIALLSEIQGRYPRHVVVTPRPENDQRIAAAAWGRLLTLDELDADALYAFIVRYRNRGPETVSM